MCSILLLELPKVLPNMTILHKKWVSLIYAYLASYFTSSPIPILAYPITTLARFAAAPSKLHYVRLKGIAKYFRQTIDWGILYWRSAPNNNLSTLPLNIVISDSSLPVLPQARDHLWLY
jgi:hypothetical protein